MAGRFYETTRFVSLPFLTSTSVVQNIPPFSATELVDYPKVRTSVKIDSVRELYQTKIGAHPEQCRYSKNPVRYDLLTRCLVPRGDLPESLLHMKGLDGYWRILGLTPSSYTPGTIGVPCADMFSLNSG